MKWTNKGHEFDDLAKEVLKKGHEYYIWGAKLRGASFYEAFKEEIHIAGFLDADPERRKQPFYGYDVLDPNEFLKEKKENVRIITASLHKREMFAKAETVGYLPNKDIFYAEEFNCLYKLYQYNHLEIHYIGYRVTERCTLRCKQCAGLIPYIQEPRSVSLELMKKDLAQLFSCIDKLNSLGIMGGDPMLLPYINDLLVHVGETYLGTKISNIIFCTNAVILPTDEMLHLWKKYDVDVRFTDYREFTGKKQKIDEMIALLTAHGIRYICQKSEYWLDFGYPQQSNGLTTEEQLVALAERCSERNPNFMNGRMYYCSRADSVERSGYYQIAEGDYFELDHFTSKKELMEYILGYTDRGYIELCKKCNGTFGENDRKIPVGEQLSRSVTS